MPELDLSTLDPERRRSSGRGSARAGGLREPRTGDTVVDTDGLGMSAMSGRDLVCSGERLEPHRPRFLVSRTQAAAIVVFGYLVIVSSASLLLGLVEVTQGYDDYRNIDATVLFAVLLLIPFGWALVGLARRSRLPALAASHGHEE